MPRPKTPAATAQAASKPAAKRPRKTRMALVVLSDRKDTYLRLVRPEVLDWIHQPYNPPENNKVRHGYAEEVPESIREEYAKEHGQTTCNVTVGSCDNDRAMRAPGESFQTLVKLMKYVEKHNMKIVGEYHGLVY